MIMETVIDDSRSWTTKYPTYDEDTRDHVQKTVVIQGIAKAQIKIEHLSLDLATEKAGAKASVLITAEVAGKDTILAEFTETGVTYKTMEADVSFIADDGQPVTLRWHLKTASSKALMTVISYSYSVIPVDAPVENPGEVLPEEPTEDNPESCIITIKCSLDGDLKKLIDDLKTYVGERNVEISIKTGLT